LKKRLGVLSVVTLLVAAFFALSTVASNSELYFSSDKNGQNRVTNVQEGSQVFMVVYDPDENIDCDVRDKFWTDAKVFDPKTGAYLDWVFADTRDGDPVPAYGTYEPGHYPDEEIPTGIVYFEETGADTGLFVSRYAFQIGTRIDFAEEEWNTHWVGADFDGTDNAGDWQYVDGVRTDLDVVWTHDGQTSIQHGRFENMDTLIGMVVDQNDETDVATAMMKIIDTQGTITWDQQIYKDPNTSATITICDADENLNCNLIEYVPVFIIVNPESWNGVVDGSPTGFCALKRTGGVDPDGAVQDAPIAWYNIYDSGLAFPGSPSTAGNYYMQYPVQSESNVTWFDTVADGRYHRGHVLRSGNGREHGMLPAEPELAS